MNQLVTKSLQAKDVNLLIQFPTELLTSSERDLLTFIFGYFRRHSTPPSVKNVVDEFPSFIPYRFAPSLWEEEEEPLTAIYDETLSRKLVEATEAILRQVQNEIDATGKVPLELLHEIESLHTLSEGVSRYSTFDRSTYFRRTTTNLPFGILNKHIGGIANGDYMLVVGRLGTGKSTISQWLAKSFWEQGRRILYVSAEMLGVDVFARIDAMVAEFNPLKLRHDRTVDVDEHLSIATSIAADAAGEIFIPKTRLLTPVQIIGYAKNLKIDIVFVDGVYLLNPSSGKYTSKWEKVAAVSNELKQAALELDIPIIGTSQVKRGAGKEIDPEDIGYSDSLGQDADFVVAIQPNKTVKERLELLLIKNRYGGNCGTSLYVDYDTMQIFDETRGPADGTEREVSLDEWKRT